MAKPEIVAPVAKAVAPREVPQGKPLSGEVAAEIAGEKTVTMVFPKAVMLLTLNRVRVRFEAGPQEVPVSLKDHPYLKANGAHIYTRAEAAADADVSAADAAKVKADAAVVDAKAKAESAAAKADA